MATPSAAFLASVRAYKWRRRLRHLVWVTVAFVGVTVLYNRSGSTRESLGGGRIISCQLVKDGDRQRLEVFWAWRGKIEIEYRDLDAKP